MKDETYELHVPEPQSWEGIRFISEFGKNDIYVVSFSAWSTQNNSLLEIILPTSEGEIRIASFILNKNAKEYQFKLTPLFNSNSISFRMSTHGGFSTGNIHIRDARISSLTPIKNSDDLREKIKILGPWFHQININGIKTRDISKTDSPSTKQGFTKNFSRQDYIDNPLWIWSRFKDFLPMDLKGSNVLDVACNCGFYSFELARRGADVLGIDNSYDDIVRAKFAKEVLQINNTDFWFFDVTQMYIKFKTKFDLVLCLGLLYHLREPQLIINSISKLTDAVIFETIADTHSTSSELIHDPSITSDGYVPTLSWLRNAFHSAGFSKISQITPQDFYRTIFICEK